MKRRVAKLLSLWKGAPPSPLFIRYSIITHNIDWVQMERLTLSDKVLKSSFLNHPQKIVYYLRTQEWFKKVILHVWMYIFFIKTILKLWKNSPSSWRVKDTIWLNKHLIKKVFWYFVIEYNDLSTLSYKHIILLIKPYWTHSSKDFIVFIIRCSTKKLFLVLNY